MICPACGAFDRVSVLRRDGVPVLLNRAWEDRDQARAVPQGRLDLVGCRQCDHVWNAAFEAEKIAYDPKYENRQDRSPRFDAYLDERVDALAPLLPPGGLAVEIGCGQGEFLQRLCARTGATGFGFDPAFRGPPTQGRARFERAGFRADRLPRAPDVVVCRHVIEHLADPGSMLQQLRAGLTADRRTRVVFECPDLGWIVENQVPWDFFYEHVQYFSASSLRAVFGRGGFMVEAHHPVFDGQYQWLVCRPGPARAQLPARPRGWVRGARDLGTRTHRFLDTLRHALLTLAEDGPVALWGAGAKGVTLAQLIDPEGRILVGLIDINPAKQGGFAGGSGLPILGPDALTGRGIRHAVVLNPNYAAEVAATVRELSPGTFLHLAEPDGSLSCSPPFPSASPRSIAPPSSNAA